MSPRARRLVIPLVVTVLALLVLAVMVFNQPATPPPGSNGDEQSAETTEETNGETNGDPASNDAADEDDAGPDGGVESQDDGQAAGDAAGDDTGDGDQDESAEQGNAQDGAQDDGPDDDQANQPRSLDGLYPRAPNAETAGADFTPEPAGSLDRREARALVEYSNAGAGIGRIVLADQWETASARHRADDHYEALAEGVAPDLAPPLPPLEEHYVIRNDPVGGTDIPLLAASTVVINGQRVRIFDIARDSAFNPILDDEGKTIPVWSETGLGESETVIYNGDDEPIVRITRQFKLGDGYDITLDQTIENLSGSDLELQFVQYGPGDLQPDRSRYMDRRRFRFGYMFPQQRDPQRRVFSQEDTDLILERQSVAKNADRAIAATGQEKLDYLRLWPNAESVENNYELSWFAASNRYFAVAVHPLGFDIPTGGPQLAPMVSEIRIERQPPSGQVEDPPIMTLMYSPVSVLEADTSSTTTMGIYAGPQDRRILDVEEPYSSLGLGGLILYQMSNCCAICTWQWLAHLLLWFLTVLHDYVVFDWAIAIIILVVVVRALLHPITKRAQINMQRFSRQMGKLKPEIDKLQKKYASDPKRMQQENLRLMREHGVNPFQMLGCLPMFLQTPIWIALYAMLYFAFDLRQEAAFFGLFQNFGNWQFLGDLSSADHFFWELETPFHFLMWNITGINLLPFLMGAIFFVQQKYMSPPPSPTMSKEQMNQQKIMRVMMVVLFPLMLYSAPSGLTLYIITSSTIGILESRYIRTHIDAMDLEALPKQRTDQQRKTSKRDPHARAFAAAAERRSRKGKGAKQVKNYKKRK